MRANNFIINRPQSNILAGGLRKFKTEASSILNEPYCEVFTPNGLNRQLNPIQFERKNLRRGKSKENHVLLGERGQNGISRRQTCLVGKEGSVLLQQQNDGGSDELQKRRKEGCLKRLQQKFQYLMELNSERYKMHRKTGNIEAWIQTKHSVKMSSSLMNVMENLEKIEKELENEREIRKRKNESFRAFNFEPIKQNWSEIKEKKKMLMNYELAHKKETIQRELPRIQYPLQSVVEQKSKKNELICEKRPFEDEIVENRIEFQNKQDKLRKNNFDVSIEPSSRDRQMPRAVKTEQQQVQIYSQINSALVFTQKQQSHLRKKVQYNLINQANQSKDTSLIEYHTESFFFQQKKKKKARNNDKVPVYKKNRMNLLGQSAKTTGILGMNKERAKLKGYEGIRRKKKSSEKHQFLEMNKQLIKLREDYGVVVRDL